MSMLSIVGMLWKISLMRFLTTLLTIYTKLIKYILQFLLFMLSSFHFEKDCNSTQGYELEPQLCESSFDYVQTIDEFDLEQSCLLRLKAQREKIEELTKLYQENEKELLSRAEKEKEMSQKIEHLQELAAFKGQWGELKQSYDALVKKHQMTCQQLVDLKRSFQELSLSSSDQCEQLKQQVKHLKEQRLLSDTHWEAILEDKQELIKRQGRIAQQKQYELCQKIQKLEEKIETLQEAVAQKDLLLQSRAQQHRLESLAKEEDLVCLEKMVQAFKKQNSQWKAKMVNMQDSFDKEKSEYLQALQQLKMHVKVLRKDQAEKENQIYQFKQMIKKCDTKNQALESTVLSLKTNLKKFKANTDTSMKKVTSSSEEQRLKQQMFIQQLKAQIEKQMQEKGLLAAQVKKLKGYIDRKEQQQKQRKLLLMTQFREIDKMQKAVKKIF